MIKSPHGNDIQLASSLAHSILDLHILPTEKCNFRCVYCYEDFALGKMPPRVVTGIKNFLAIRMPELRQLRLAWFGGEPLAAADIVLDISHYAKELAKRQGCAFNFGMTTNAYLLDRKRFQNLIGAGVTAFQISLDGPEDIHDKTRLRADGGGTFQKIWQNLVAMANTHHVFEVILRIHVTPLNYHHLPQLLTQIKQQFGRDKRFKIFLKAIANLGGPNMGTFEVLTGKTRVEILKQLNDLLGDEIERHELSKDNQPYICYAAAQNAWVIRADGQLAKCTVMFNDDRNRIGYLNEDGTLELEQDKLNLWLHGLKNKDIAAMGCPAAKLPALTMNTSRLKQIPVVVQP